jgi:putative SOS response-associated peptidase YedK
MCGRFTLFSEINILQQEFDLSDVLADFQPRYNIAPSQAIAVVTDPVARRLEMYRWGLIPSWAKDLSIGYRLINARAETLSEKPAFRQAFARRRCLILADGFYEWRHPKVKGVHSAPYYFHLTSNKPFTFAGLWETWKDAEGKEIRSSTIITCPANKRVGQLHERMPVILDAPDSWNWLAPDATTKDLSALLKPYPAEKMAVYPVSPLVNNPANDLPRCIEPVVV